MLTTASSVPGAFTPPVAPAIPEFDLTGMALHAPAYLADPYTLYAQCRANTPLARVAWPAAGGQMSRWVFRHADVLTALTDNATFVKNASAFTPPSPQTALPGSVPGLMDSMPKGVFSSDPPRHTALRGAIEMPFREAIDQAPAIAKKLSNDILDGIRSSGTRRMELMADYAIKVPSGTLFTLLGIPQDHWTTVRGMIGAIVMGHDSLQSMAVRINAGTTSLALTAYFQALLRQVAKRPDETLMGRMLTGALAAGFTDDDVQATLFDFVVAGYLSTTFLIGNGILNLLQHPEQMVMLRDGRAPMRDAISEMLRYDAPAQIVDRLVATPTTLGGVSLVQGEMLRLVLGSANRDDGVFVNASSFDIARTDGGNAVPFGAGIHHCIGAPLVGMVAPIAIGALVERLPNMTIAGYVQWQTDPYLRSPSNLPLAI